MLRLNNFRNIKIASAGNFDANVNFNKSLNKDYPNPNPPMPYSMSGNSTRKFQLYQEPEDICTEVIKEPMFESSKTTITVSKIHDLSAIGKNFVPKCNRIGCFPCQNLSESNFFLCNSSNHIFVTNNKVHVTCDTKKVIYAIRCSCCGVTYIGKTKGSLRSRFYDHKSKFMRKNKTGLPVLYQHFSKCIGNPIVSILAALDEGDNLGNTESTFIKATRSLFPYGLNDSLAGTCYVSAHSERNVYQEMLDFEKSCKMRQKSKRVRGPKNTNTGKDIHEMFQWCLKNVSISRRINFFRRIIFQSRTNALKNLAQLLLDHPLKIDPTTKACIDDLIRSKVTPSPPHKTSKRKNVVIVNFKDKAMENYDIENAFRNTVYPDGDVGVCYKYADPLGGEAFNYSKIVSQMDKNHNNNCKCRSHHKYHYHDNGHVATGNLNFIRDFCKNENKNTVETLINLLQKGPKFRRENQIFNDFENLVSCTRDETLTAIQQHVKIQSKKYPKRATAYQKWGQAVSAKLKKVEDITKSASRRSYDNEFKLLRKLQRQFVFSYIDKCSNNISCTCRCWHAKQMRQEIEKTSQYEKINKTEDNVLKMLQDEIKTLSNGHAQSSDKFASLHLVLKMHKKGKRYICSNTANKATGDIARKLTIFLKAIYNSRRFFERVASDLYDKPNSFFVIDNSIEAANILEKMNDVQNFGSMDFSALYDNIAPGEAIREISEIIRKSYNGRKYLSLYPNATAATWSNKHIDGAWNVTSEQLIEVLTFVMDNQFIKVGDAIFRQIKGIPMGSSPAPYVANLYLFALENRFVRNNPDMFQHPATVMRFLDDVLYINCNYPEIATDIYGDILPFTRDDPVQNTLAFLDLNLKLEPTKKFNYATYDKRDAYNFKINKYPYASSVIHSKTLRGVGISQLIRCMRTNLHLFSFAKRSAKILLEMVENGGSIRDVHAIWKKFASKHYNTKRYASNAKHTKKLIFDLLHST